MMGLVALVTMTMVSCMHVKIGDKDLSLADALNNHRNDTPTQVHEVGNETAMQAFDEVKVNGGFNVIYEQGGANSVRVDGTVEQLEKMTIYVKDGDLYIDSRKNEPSGTFDGLRVFVTSTMLDGIEIAGSGAVTAPKTMNVNDMSITVSGSGKVTLAQMNCKELEIEIAGSGDVTTGPVQASKVNNEIAGSGDINIAALTCRYVYNEIAGSGDIVLDNLNVDNVKNDIAGSGDITLNGKVGNHSNNIAGSGKVHLNGK